MVKAYGYAAHQAREPLAPFHFEHHELGPRDVQIDIAWCGVCHSDLHQVRDEWGGARFPLVPGHEIIGTIRAVGAEVTKHKLGDTVGVGCMVLSCKSCGACHDGDEQYCEKGAVFTYNSRYADGSPTYGGYANRIVVDEDFTLKVPANLNPAAAAPLLCAGVTTWSPLRRWKVGPGQHVAVVGLGGLGHMGVKFAKAMGAHVTLFTTSQSKVEAAKALGADEVVLTREAGWHTKLLKRFDFILDTVSAEHDLNAQMLTLKRNGTMVLVGLPEKPTQMSAGAFVQQRRTLAGSMIGGIAETQEMLDFCGEHNIVADIEVIAMADINEAYERMLRSDVRYRFVIDLKTLAE